MASLYRSQYWQTHSRAFSRELQANYTYKSSTTYNIFSGGYGYANMGCCHSHHSCSGGGFWGGLMNGLGMFAGNMLGGLFGGGLFGGGLFGGGLFGGGLFGGGLFGGLGGLGMGGLQGSSKTPDAEKEKDLDQADIETRTKAVDDLIKNKDLDKAKELYAKIKRHHDNLLDKVNTDDNKEKLSALLKRLEIEYGSEVKHGDADNAGNAQGGQGAQGTDGTEGADGAQGSGNNNGTEGSNGADDIEDTNGTQGTGNTNNNVIKHDLGNFTPIKLSDDSNKSDDEKLNEALDNLTKSDLIGIIDLGNEEKHDFIKRKGEITGFSIDKNTKKLIVNAQMGGQIGKNRAVTLTYEISIKNGEIILTSENEQDYKLMKNEKGEYALIQTKGMRGYGKLDQRYIPHGII